MPAQFLTQGPPHHRRSRLPPPTIEKARAHRGASCLLRSELVCTPRVSTTGSTLFQSSRCSPWSLMNLPFLSGLTVFLARGTMVPACRSILIFTPRLFSFSCGFGLRCTAVVLILGTLLPVSVNQARPGIVRTPGDLDSVVGCGCGRPRLSLYAHTPFASVWETPGATCSLTAKRCQI